MQNCYSLSALQGIQARQAFFVLNLPLSIVAKLFEPEDTSIPVDQRSQRVLNQTRVKQISDYIVNNPNSYVLPPLVAYVKYGGIKFEPNEQYKSLGVLHISIDAVFGLFDGQHRCAAIKDALKKRDYLGYEKIPVYLMQSTSLEQAQQIFADINLNAVKPAQSIKLLYNQRDQVTAFTKSMIKEIQFLTDYTDLENTNLPAKSDKLFAFSSLYQANNVLWKGLGDDPAKPIKITQFWETVIPSVSDWTDLFEGLVEASTLRAESVAAHGVAAIALAEAGLYAMKTKETNWMDYFTPDTLGLIDWSRDHTDWQNRIIVNGKITKTRRNILLMANVIIEKIGLQLNKAQKEYELALENLKAA